MNPPPALRADSGEWNTYNRQPPNARFNEQGQRILPGGGGGARFIPPDEYKEFLQLGHGGVFDLDLDNVDVAPWRLPGADLSAYFNYGLNEHAWREYTSKFATRGSNSPCRRRFARSTENRITRRTRTVRAACGGAPIGGRDGGGYAQAPMGMAPMGMGMGGGGGAGAWGWAGWVWVDPRAADPEDRPLRPRDRRLPTSRWASPRATRRKEAKHPERGWG